jgi:PAS domain S-box-containing protein
MGSATPSRDYGTGFGPELLRRLFERAPGFMALTRGPDHVFEMVNEAYRELTGYRDLTGKNVREAFPDLKGQGLFTLLDRAFASGEPVEGAGAKISLVRRPGGEPEERVLDFVFQPLTDEAGQVTGLFVEGHDVTERHLATEALRESEERFRLIADSAPVPMWVTKLDRKRGFVNRAYVEFFGVSYEECVDYDWRTIIHPEDRERILAESVAGEARLETFALEGRFRRADGEWRWIRSISQPRIGPQGEHIGFIGVAHDITASREAEAALREVNETLERRVAERTADLSAAMDRIQSEVAERQRAEEALRQAQKMEAVGQLTGGIAHDFNNLLTPIMGGLELIAAKLDDERLKRIATTALEASRRGAKLTGQLLAFSRIQRISMAPVAVNQVIERMEELLRHSIGGAVRVETQLGRDVGHGICDANQLENAVLNLAINARDAMPDGGTLTISTGMVDLDAGPDVEAGRFVRVSVADTGEGMEPEVAARATEPFFSTKPLGKGTGLGLAQVYGIARQAGGTLRIESSPGQGTTVHLMLPAAAGGQPAEGEQVAEAKPTPAAPRATILAVDDDADVRAFLADSLEGLGHRALAAASGAEGLELLKEHEIDLLLLDYAMPEMHGGEVARAARAAHPGLPIVFVTGYAETRQLEEAMGADVCILRKPFTLTELAQIVASALAEGVCTPAS